MTYTYITASDVATYLQRTLTTAETAAVTAMVPAMMDMVDQYCNRTWNFSNPVVENFDALEDSTAPYAKDTFFVGKPSISATPADSTIPLAGGVISVTVGGVVWDMHYVYNYGTHIKMWVRPMTIMLPNPLGFKSVQITYNSDASQALPATIKQAMIEWTARKVLAGPDAGRDPVQVAAGTVSARYKEDATSGIPDFVVLALDQYRLIPVDRM